LVPRQPYVIVPSDLVSIACGPPTAARVKRKRWKQVAKQRPVQNSSSSESDPEPASPYGSPRHIVSSPHSSPQEPDDDKHHNHFKQLLLREGPWTAREDALLLQGHLIHGHRKAHLRWARISKIVGENFQNRGNTNPGAMPTPLQNPCDYSTFQY